MHIGKLSIILLIPILLLAAFNLWSARGSGGPPLKTADELGRLSDDQLEVAVRLELGRDAYREGSRPDAWRSMHPTARQLWSVAAIGDIDPLSGLADWLAGVAAKTVTSPGPEDMRDGLDAMGLLDARRVMEEIIAHRDSPDPASLAKMHVRLTRALQEPEALAQRRAWVRKHLHELIPR